MINEPRFVARCARCGAAWEIDFEPVTCRCDYSDPDVPVVPWTLRLEAA